MEIAIILKIVVGAAFCYIFAMSTNDIKTII